MKHLFYTLLFCCSLGIGSLNAQFSHNKEAFSARFIFPNYQFQFDNEIDFSDFTYGAQFAYSRHLNNALNLSIPLNFAWADFPVDNSVANTQEQLFLGIDALLQLKLFEGSRVFNPSLFAGVGFHAENLESFEVGTPLGILFDIKIGEYTYLSPKFEYRIGFGDDRNNLMPGIGVKVLLGEGSATPEPNNDRDGDGVPNDQDLCPDQAGLASMNGCPDSDGDGITDGEDACPNQAGTSALNGCPDRDGDGVGDQQDQCPDDFGPVENNGCPYQDTDGDGVNDQDDQCPNEPGSRALNGCPDRDGDGVADRDDQCPNVPGTPATNGCPDTDRDGVIDSRDKCPSTPGTIENDGCPDLTDAEKEILAAAAQAVQFETASAVLKSASIPVLDQVAQILSRYPDLKASIDGHTDSIGSAINNRSLSEKRAKACYDYLISKGIAPARLSFQGFGEDKPIADNRTREGREQNRRVEFNVSKN